MKEINIIFRTLWHERSNSVDEPYKQWVKMGFDWCHDLMCSSDNKTRMLSQIAYDFSKLAQRHDEVYERKYKLDDQVLELKSVLREIIGDIETAHKMNNKQVNLKWKSVNKAKEMLK